MILITISIIPSIAKVVTVLILTKLWHSYTILCIYRNIKFFSENLNILFISNQVPSPLPPSPSKQKMHSPNTLRIMNRCMEFISASNFERIHEHFQIPSVQQDENVLTTLNIWMEPTDFVGQYILVIQKKTQSLAEKNSVPMNLFPREIERLIYGYLRDENTIRIEMKIPPLFPFRPPHFKLLSATQHTDTLTKIIGQLNCDMSSDFSPASGIRGTLLTLLSNLLQGMNYLR